MAETRAARILVFEDHSVVRAHLACVIGLRSERSKKTLVPLLGAILAVCVLCGGCRSKIDEAAEVKITRVPDASPGGPEKLDYIEGTVRNAKAGQHIVLYAHSGLWWVQPFADRTTTTIQPDGSWKNSTHLGTEYGALLVDADYVPPARTTALPPVGNGVVAVLTAAGRPVAPIVKKTIHFSGYDWTVRSAASDRGGEPDAYDPTNAWTDKNGFLHLRTAERDGRWTCAEVSLARSLGYGTYKFVILDSAHLPPSAVVSFLTFDEIHPEESAKEIDIELSRWGDPKRKNAQYVIQPYYVPENVFRFDSPAGSVTHLFHWEPGKVTFESAKGSVQGAVGHPFNVHIFSSGIPAPSGETVRINLYDFRHSQHPSQPPAEVVIEKFEYFP
ncbi:MAG: glycoside hydrolase family 16 protein [Terracidiphilus sp.]